MSDDLISRLTALEHLRKRLIQTANNNVGFVCDAGATFEDASERVKTWLDEVPSIDAVPMEKWQELKETILELRDNGGMATQKEVSGFLLNLMDVLDGEDVDAVLTARWIGGEIGHCSCCGHYGCASDIWSGCDGDRFCPNCGARMDERKES